MTQISDLMIVQKRPDTCVCRARKVASLRVQWHLCLHWTNNSTTITFSLRENLKKSTRKNVKRKDSENKYDEYEIRIKQKIYSNLRKQCNRARKYSTLSIIHRLSLSDFLWFFPSFIGMIYFCGIYRKPGRAELNRIHVISKNIWNVESTGIFILFDRRNNFLPRFYLV